MRTLRNLFVFLGLILFSVSSNAQRKIQVALLLDTSNSMDGLIDQTKSQLWSIVNEMASAKAEGRSPQIEIALYEYGNDNLKAEGNYIRQIMPLSADLDKISEALFSLKTHGGSEYCGAVIAKGISELSWSNSNRDLKLIYIAGNEPFNQGSVDYKTACANAIKKGITVNTIFCGRYEEGVSSFWKNGADLADGKYFNIDHNQATVYIETPYDKQINDLNLKLNDTYIGYGSLGHEKKQNQATQDANAAGYSASNAAERTVSKSSAAYRADDWDLVDAVKNEKVKISDIKKEELPAELKGKDAEEIKTYVEQKAAERTKIQKAIQELNTKRSEYIAAENKKTGAQNTLHSAMTKAMREKAEKLGFVFPNP